MGHRDPETWTRYLTYVLAYEPRKNAKTFLAMLFGMLFLFSGQEKAGSILITASSQDQSRRTFDLLLATLRTNPKLFEQLRIQELSKLFQALCYPRPFH